MLTPAPARREGFVASELVKQLLEKGYDVRGTVRDPDNAAKVGHLMKLAEALPGRLDLFACDLLQAGAPGPSRPSAV